jgi:hypothetical protein
MIPMQHLVEAQILHRALERLATMHPPDLLATEARMSGRGRIAVASIIARGHWVQINGQWHKRKDAIG